MNGGKKGRVDSVDFDGVLNGIRFVYLDNETCCVLELFRQDIRTLSMMR